jgi:hypothetical protein
LDNQIEQLLDNQIAELDQIQNDEEAKHQEEEKEAVVLLASYIDSLFMGGMSNNHVDEFILPK